MSVRRTGRPSSGGGPHPRRLPTALTLAVLLLTGCGAPPEPRGTSVLPTRAATPSTTGEVPSTAPPVVAPPSPATPSPSADPGLVAVACQGGPTQQRIIDLVRGRGGLLPRDAKVRVRTGPLCAADWQFTAFEVTGYEPLLVVTRNQAGTLRLVTAGTDVCSIEVRVTGPPGIRTLACGTDVPDGAPPPPATPAVPVPTLTTPVPTTAASTPATPTPTTSAPAR